MTTNLPGVEAPRMIRALITYPILRTSDPDVCHGSVTTPGAGIEPAPSRGGRGVAQPADPGPARTDRLDRIEPSLRCRAAGLSLSTVKII